MAPCNSSNGVAAGSLSNTGGRTDLCVCFTCGTTRADLAHQGLREDSAARPFTDSRTMVLNHVSAVISRGPYGEMRRIHTRRVVANLMAHKQARRNVPVVQLPRETVSRNSLLNARDCEESVAFRQHSSPSPALTRSAFINVAPKLLFGKELRGHSDRGAWSRRLAVQEPAAVTRGAHSPNDLAINAVAPRDSARANAARTAECASTKRVAMYAPPPIVSWAPSTTGALLATIRHGTDIIRHVGPLIQVRPNPGPFTAVAGHFSLTATAA